MDLERHLEGVGGHMGLNEVRPGRPEQSDPSPRTRLSDKAVSMKSGLEDRNNEYPVDLYIITTARSQ